MTWRRLTLSSLLLVMALVVPLSVISPSPALADDTTAPVATDPIMVDPSQTLPPAIGPDATAVALTDGTSLPDTAYSLSEIDLSSGAVMGEDLRDTLTTEDTTTMTLDASGGLAFDPSIMLASASQQTAAQQQQSLAANDAAAASANAQQSVGPDGCPTSAPPNTLRSGASDVASLCAKSVSQARTPQAALAIKYALNHLGLPYSQPLRNADGHYDCSSFVTRSYQAAGVPIAPPGQNAPTTGVIAAAPWAIHIDESVARPGDLVEPSSEHVVMLLADGFLVQASSTGDVTNVTRVWWSTPYITVWIDPSKA